MTAGARAGAEEEVRDRLPDVGALADALDAVDYLADPGLATAMFLAVRLPQPLLLEGEPGVGKTEAAKALARVLDTPLYRLQCFEGIDAAEALYEWNHPRQLLGIRLAEARGAPLAEDDLFGPDYLLRRPLLQAIEHPGPRPAVLLLDEIDRADAEFEAFTFEVLAEAAVTVPELGTIRAAHPPVVVLTSNRTRDLHDALTRRCLYHWIDYPSPERVAEIVRRRVPGSAEPLAIDAAAAVTRLRSLDMVKPPGIAEVIDWVAALIVLGISRLDAAGGRGQLGFGAEEPRRPGAGPQPRRGLAGRCLTSSAAGPARRRPDDGAAPGRSADDPGTGGRAGPGAAAGPAGGPGRPVLDLPGRPGHRPGAAAGLRRRLLRDLRCPPRPPLDPADSRGDPTAPPPIGSEPRTRPAPPDRRPSSPGTSEGDAGRVQRRRRPGGGVRTRGAPRGGVDRGAAAARPRSPS